MDGYSAIKNNPSFHAGRQAHSADRADRAAKAISLARGHNQRQVVDAEYTNGSFFPVSWYSFY